MKPLSRHGGLSVRASNDRWLFGYADVVTLLFACFASLYAARLTPAAAPEAQPDINLPDTAQVEMSDLHRSLADAIGRPGSLPGIDLNASGRGIVISLPEAGSFPAGRADVSGAARDLMRQIAIQLRAESYMIRVEGHTDDAPIHTTAYASNWELSTARAVRVVQMLIDEGIAPWRLSAAGYAEFHPRVPNETALARARNRRVDIVILDPGRARREEPEAAR
ncbi:MAG TPA: OmpA family protein [Vicinamibacterales bacterium]|nr:OmpA family protein [Vicinamibacterales bacterium]